MEDCSKKKGERKVNSISPLLFLLLLFLYVA